MFPFQIIHNYGHGGSGITIFWGCAKEVFDLVVELKAENHELKSIIQTVSDPMVSGDFNHNPHSSIIDLSEVTVIKNNFCRILSWYDNEWGFSNRLLDVIKDIIQ